jgi:hypothetical protein
LALAESKDNKVVESLELQIQHHHKQKQIIGLRQARYEKITKNLHTIQQRMEKANILQDADNLQVSIFFATTVPVLSLKENFYQHIQICSQKCELENYVLIISRIPSTGPSRKRNPCCNISDWELIR